MSLTLLAACGASSSTTPSKSDATKQFEASLKGEGLFTNSLKVISFEKTDGLNVETGSKYQLDFKAKLACEGSGGESAKSGCCYQNEQYFPMFGGSCSKWLKPGEEIEITGQLGFLKKESGWALAPIPKNFMVYHNWKPSIKNQPAAPPEANRVPAQTKIDESRASQDLYDNWAGEWLGVEGNSLHLAKQADRTTFMLIFSGNNPSSQYGTLKGRSIEFSRAGRAEKIRFGSGAETGLKWLADKKECLIIAEGEGYCRK